MKSTLVSAARLTVLLALVSAARLNAGTASIDMDFSKPGPHLNPRMYGIFLEDLNHGVDGGLYAELIRNRGFEDAKPPEGYQLVAGRWLDSTDRNAYDADFSRFGYFTNGLPFWSLVQEGGARGSMHLDLANPLNAATPRSLRLEIEDLGSGRLGVANQGFWGIGVRQGEEYRLSFWARCAGNFQGPLVADLESEDGSRCAERVSISGVGSGWSQFHATLKATRSDPKAHFVLASGSRGTVWLDMVSLFPATTFKNRANGLRPDIAQMIADLKPGFVRFPGGCVVEGGTIETAFNWEDTVGPVEQRREIWGPWNYRRTGGMGFLEYLQFCEDLGAQPLYVGFAGETCMFRHVEDVPMDRMSEVAGNFLDAIEYATGGDSTAWGKRRAADGHPKPFDLKMVEVGNEGGTRAFPERYAYVFQRLKARYPDLTYILDYSFLQRAWMRGQTSNMEDNHFYNSPEWFMDQTHHYDNRDRSLPPVYDGEVAVTSAEGGPDKGNLIAALAEGAFLLGLERNADVVRMVSYAPLLANVEGRTDWHGMIYFDTTRVFGTVSYYLWKLFAESRPDYTVKTDVEFHPDKPRAITGAIGVGSWETAAEFKNVRVEKDGRVLYQSDFGKGDAGWHRQNGDWSVVDGAYGQRDDAVGLSWVGDENWTDYTLTLQARKLHGPEGFLVVFGRKGEDKYWWNVGGWGNREHAIEFNQNPVGRHVAGSIETGRWYNVRVEVHDRTIRCFLDGKLIHDVTAPTPDRFFASAGRDAATGEVVLKVINVSQEPVEARLAVEGLPKLASRGRLTVLSGARRMDNNSLDNPLRIAPAVSDIDGVGNLFSRSFPPYSLTVLRLKPE